MQRMLAILPLVALLGGCIDMPQSRQRQPLRQSTAQVTPAPLARQCLSRLGLAQVRFTPLPDEYYGAGCATLNTVRIASLQSDEGLLALTRLGPVACPLAETFAGWARFGVDRAARQILGSPLVEIETFGSYSCRNVAGSARLSAHATANAIDVSGFILADGRRITVRDDWSGGTTAERQFLRVIRESACKRFSTVLSPDYNAAHQDHFHVEAGGNARTFCR